MQYLSLISPIPTYYFTQFFSVYIIVGIVVFIYVFFAYCLERIGRKTGVTNTWRAYIPIISYFVLLDAADITYWWFLLAASSFFISLLTLTLGRNIVGFIIAMRPLLQALSLCSLALIVYIYMRISERLGKSPWLGLLMIVPIANVIFPIYLAFSHSTATGSTAQKISSPVTKNWKHPEQLDSEVFLGNYTTAQFQNEIHWQSKRLGKIPYTKDGQPELRPDFFPVFVSREELQKAGVNIG